MNPIQPEYISLVDLGMAYRKAKVDLYYTGDNSILKVLEYEEKLVDNLNSLHKKLLSKDPSWLSESGSLGSWTLAPKSIDLKTEKLENLEEDLIHSDPEKHWKSICSSLRSKSLKPTAEFRLMATPSMDFHVLSALWMSKVGHKYDKLLSECACGSRLRRQTNGEFNVWSNGTFQPYLKPFRDWRDNGIKAMHSGLRELKSIVAITADVRSFYHELNPDFIVNPDFLNIIGLKLDDDDTYLTEVFVQALNKWSASTPLKKGLPVGLPASALVANMALFELDKLIEEEIVPIYYSRYVDDILVVMKKGSDFSTRKEVWDWIILRSHGLLKLENKEEKKAIIFSSSYLEKSCIEFYNDKNKIFILEGDSGKTLVNSIEREIKARSSEWRALPDLPDNPEYIATTLLSATQADGESADNLRKADVFSMRRAKFAIELRDFEAYERDLFPDDWQKQRRSFLDACIQHVLVLPTFFNLAIYLPRLIRLATACEDFAELRKIIERLTEVVKDVEEHCETDIKSCKDKNAPIFSKWQEQIRRIIDENIKMAFPVRLSRSGQQLWDDQFGDKGLWQFETDIHELKKQQYHLFSHDLAYMPFRFIGMPKELNSRRGIPAKKTVIFLDGSTLLENKIYVGLQIVAKSIKCFQEQSLPYGLIFATRPFNLTELYFLSKDPYSPDHSEDIAKSIFALRGFSPEKKMPLRNDKNILEVSVNREKSILHIALASWKTDNNSWIASITNNHDSDLTRYKRFTYLLNEVLKSSKSPDYLIFPELSIPARWFLRFAHKLQRKGISLVAGVEYLHRPKRVVNNQVWVALSHDGLGFPSMIVFRQDKLKSALYEEQELYRLAGLKLKPLHPWKTPPVIRHGDFFFAILVCSELTNITYRAALCGKIDALFVPEWNKDTETFNALVESAALDIHAYIIQCNDRQYGDSRIRAPYKESWMRDLVRLKGGVTDYFVIGEIDIMSLRKFQSSYRSPDGSFKPVPDGFELKLAHERKVLPQGNNYE